MVNTGQMILLGSYVLSGTPYGVNTLFGKTHRTLYYLGDLDLAKHSGT